MESNNIAEQILKNNNISYNTILPMTGGQINLVFSIDNKFVLKVGREETANQRLLEESKFLKELSSNIPVPEIVAYGEEDGSAYQLQKFIKGDLLTRHWKTYSSEVKEDIIKQLVDSLKILHKVKYNDYGRRFNADKYNAWSNFLDYRMGVIKEDLKQITYIPESIIESVFKFYSQLRELIDDEDSVFVHGDIWPGNILISNGKISGIIDLEFSLQAPKEYELATIESFCLYPNDYAEAERYTITDFSDFALLLKNHYPELTKSDNFRKKLDMYQVIKVLEAHLSYLKRFSIKPENILPVNPVAKLTNYIYQEGARMF